MAGDPLKIYEMLDPDLLSLVRQTRDMALADGALPKKVKILIAMALDAAHGAPEGVAALAKAAQVAGASQQEIAETLRIAFYISGVGSVYAAAEGLGDVL